MKPGPCLNKLPVKAPADQVVKDIQRQTRRHFWAEDRIRIVLEGLLGRWRDRDLESDIAPGFRRVPGAKAMRSSTAWGPPSPAADRRAERSCLRRRRGTGEVADLRIAEEHVKLGLPLEAPDAQRRGIIDFVVPRREGLEHARTFARRVCNRAPIATELAKMLVNTAEGEERERKKRKPRFTGD